MNPGMRFPRILAVAFDAVGTLISPRERISQTYSRVGTRHGVSIAPEIVKERFEPALEAEDARDIAAGLRVDEARERDRWRRIVGTVLGGHEEQTNRCLDELWAYYGTSKAWQPMPGAVGVVAELMRRGVVVAVASNFDSRLHGGPRRNPGAPGDPPSDSQQRDRLAQAASGVFRRGRSAARRAQRAGSDGR